MLQEMIWTRVKYNMVKNRLQTGQHLQYEVSLTVCHSNMVLKRAAYWHSVTADTASLLPRLLASLQSSTETGQEHTAHSCFSLGTLWHALRDKQNHVVPCASHLVMSGNTPSPARPMQTHARRCLVPAGGYWTIRHGLFCAVTKCFSLSYRVTPTTDLCVLFLFAVSNHSPAVWFIQTASVISMKCLA